MIEQALFSLISAALGHDRVYPLVLPQKPTLPAMVYQRIGGGDDELTSSGVADLVEGRFQLDAYAKSYPEAKTTANAIRAALSGYHGSVLGVRIDAARRDATTDGFEPETKLFRVSADYIIFFEE